jgi:hypothetical protein
MSETETHYEPKRYVMEYGEPRESDQSYFMCRERDEYPKRAVSK